MRWDIRPGDGAGPLHFGASAAHVAAILGAPLRVKTDPGSSLPGSETRALDLPILHYEKGSLVEISFGLQVPGVSLDGVALAPDNRPDALRFIEKSFGPLVESFGFVVSYRASLSLTGFHDGDDDQFAVNVFARADTMASDLRRVPFFSGSCKLGGP
ncbi:hypothetical protein [Bosea sp. (in: a-proteobacteria)]|uniref:hypothetical protein n=1 Tax=Bosea sp. (in: a-proteobacteria) TaxID=1871050 RepID=UPI003B3BC1D0